MVRFGIPSEKELYNPVLQGIHALGGESKNTLLFEWVEERLDLTHEQLTLLRNSANSANDTKIRHNIRFALTHLRMAGFLDNPSHGLWKLSEIGKRTHRVKPNEVIRLKETNPISKQGVSWKRRRQRIRPVAQYISSDSRVDKGTVTELDRRVVVKSASESTVEAILWSLVSLGEDLGLGVCVARRHRQKSHKGKIFADLSILRTTSPQWLDATTGKVIDSIDVVWLQGSAAVSAFAVATSYVTGALFLQLTDLMTLNIEVDCQFFVVAPHEQSAAIRRQVGRPTFEMIGLSTRCRFVPYEAVCRKVDVAKKAGLLSHLRPSFLNDIAEDLAKKNSPIV